MSGNCPDNAACANIIVPNTGSAVGEVLQIQSSSGCFSNIVLQLYASQDCKFNTTIAGPL